MDTEIEVKRLVRTLDIATRRVNNLEAGTLAARIDKEVIQPAIEAAKQEERKTIAIDLTYGRSIYEIGIAGRIPIRKYLEALKRGERPE